SASGPHAQAFRGGRPAPGLWIDALMERRHRRRRMSAVAVALAVIGVVLVALSNAADGRRLTPLHPRAAATTPSYPPFLGIPATNVELIGAAPGEAAGEAWAQGAIGPVPANVNGQSVASREVLLRYTNALRAWQIVPVNDASGHPIGLNWVASAVTPGG